MELEQQIVAESQTLGPKLSSFCAVWPCDFSGVPNFVGSLLFTVGGAARHRMDLRFRAAKNLGFRV